MRKATLDDVDAIVRLNTIVQGLHHRALPERFKLPDSAAYALTVRAWLADENRTWFLAELEGGERVGYALAVRRERPENPLTHTQILIELEQIAVDPVVRRRGIGGALARAVIDHARRCGVGTVELSVHAFNQEAQAFFSTIGFKNTMLRMSVRLDESLP